MADPIPDVWMFEDVLEGACISHLSANGIDAPRKQQDRDALATPLVEVKAGFSGPSVNEHYWVNQSTKKKYLDCNEGVLLLTVVTRRSDKNQDHSRLRGTCRGLMQDVVGISSKMTYHRIEKMIEGGTSPNFKEDGDLDISVISFQVILSILFQTKTAQIFPN